MKIEKENKRYLLVYFALFAILLFLSLYNLDNNPIFINVDEAGTILNSYSLLKNGCDRYGTIFPIYPNNYYGGQSLLPTLCVSLFIKLFGYSLLSVRLSYAFIRIICFFFIYLSFDKHNKRMIALLFYTIWPVFIMSSRYILDCNLLIYMLIISISLLFIYYRNRKKIYILLSGLSFGLCFYCYALSYILIPLFVVFLLSYLLITKNIDKKEALLFLIPIIILGFPLLLRICVDYKIFEEFKLFGLTINRTNINRSSDIGIKNISINSFVNLILCSFVKDPFNSLSYKIGGPCLYFPIALVLVFIINILKNDKYRSCENMTLFFLLIASVILALTLNSLSTWRINYIFVPLLFISSTIVNEINKNIRYLIFSITLVIFFLFSNSYFNEYCKNYSSVMHDNGLYESYNYVKKLNKDIYIKDSKLGEEYVYYFLFDDNVDLNDYPSDYYPKIIKDRNKNISIYLEYENIDSNGVYMTFGELDDNSLKYTNIKKIGSWYVCFN